MPTSQETVAQIVLDHSECAAVFQKHRIDYCCRGKASLESAAAEQGLDVTQLLAELELAIAARQGAAEADPRKLSTTALVAHIVAHHHAYLRHALPFVEPLAAKVARVHGDHNGKLVALERIVRELSDTLAPHLDWEEGVLFPALFARDGDRAVIDQAFGSMQEEHLAVGTLLAELRLAAEDFKLPDWACTSYRTLFSELETLEGDVLRHVHLENHVLGPRFTSGAS
ncbi:MAG TPA: iron-sulfur cluster repair di-iron protein [Polyangiaceae bacterium]